MAVVTVITKDFKRGNWSERMRELHLESPGIVFARCGVGGALK
jgi:hypothetical protein